MLHCDLRVRWKVASDLRIQAAISEPKTPSFCRISGDLDPSTRKSLAIAIARFWCAKLSSVLGRTELCHEVQNPGPQKTQIICNENHHSPRAFVSDFFRGVLVRTSSTTTRDRNLQFRGAVSTGGSPLDFLCLFSSIYVQFSKTSPLKSGESSEKSSTKLLLAKNYSEIIIFEKLRFSRVISGKSLSFPEI